MPEETPEQRRARISAARAAAGRAGAQSRWGARNSTASDDGSDPELVCGTARELRELAEAMEERDTRGLTHARAVSASRLTAFKAHHPQATAAQLAGKVWCEALPTERDRRRPRNRPKLRIVNQDTDIAELWLYDYIDSWGGYWGISAQEVVEQLAQITAGRIDVHINSGGGEVFEGIAIKRALAAHPADIYVCIDSLAASIASVIAMAGDTIGIDEAAFVMIHDASGFCYGDAASMTAMADLLDLISGTIAQTYASRAGGDVESWREAMLAETWYDAPKALAAGLADEYLGATAEGPDDADVPAARAAPFDGTTWLDAIVASTATPTPSDPNPNLRFLDALMEAHAR